MCDIDRKNARAAAPPLTPPSPTKHSGAIAGSGGGQQKKNSSFPRYDTPLSCFGCGIGWFSFVMGFAFPPIWFYATILYFRNYYLVDLRERPGLAASAIAALISSTVLLISLVVVFYKRVSE